MINRRFSSLNMGYLILQVTGIITFFTRVVNIAFALSGLIKSAAPIPPFNEKAFGHLSIWTFIYCKIFTVFFSEFLFTPCWCQSQPHHFPPFLQLSMHVLRWLCQFGEQLFLFRLHTFERQSFHHVCRWNQLSSKPLKEWIGISDLKIEKLILHQIPQLTVLITIRSQ